MNNERIDELDKYYKPVENLDKIDSILFWASTVLSIGVLYENSIPWPQIQTLPSVLFVILVVIHLILSLYLRFYLMPLAEGYRRQLLLSDSLGILLTTEKTQSYYNNQLHPSIARLAANLLENALFAKSICTRMANRERVKILLYFSVWMLAITLRSTNLGLLAIITQTLFSSELIEKWLRLEILRHNNEMFYEKLYRDFLYKIDLDSMNGIASVLDTFAAYESAKAMAGIKKSSAIFKEINPSLSDDWAHIRELLGIDTLSEIGE